MIVMATTKEILTAVQDQGLLIARASSTVSAAVASATSRLDELIKAGKPVDAADLQSIYESVNESKTTLQAIVDTALQLIPTVPSPVTPTEPGAPVPNPIEPIPSDPGGVVIEPSDDGVGLDGSVDIDVDPSAPVEQ
jgi:hypothetical protein